MSSAVAPLKYPHFRALWGANMFSAAGTFIQQVAGSWLMLELTGSNAWVGWMVASSTLPLFFFSLTAGALADMFSRTRLMLIAQWIMGGSAAAMAVLTYLDLINPPLLLGLGLLLGTGLALNLPAWQAIVPDLVPRGLVASAVALNSAGFNVARAVGPAIGGVILLIYGAAAGFAINALSYLAIIAALLVIGRQLEVREKETVSMGSAIGLGLRYARFTPSFRSLLGLVALFAITSASVQSLLPNHTRFLGGGEATYGLLLGAMGVGALIGAALRGRIAERFERNYVPVTITMFGVSGVLLGLAPNVTVAVVAMVLSGLFWLLTLATLNASAQLMAPEWIRGRAMSLYSLAFAGVLPIGSILSGVVADEVGTATSLVIFGSGALVIGLLSPRFRVPKISDIATPEFSYATPAQPHPESSLEGGPVIILNTWVIDDSDYAAFTGVMNQLRLVRLSTGAYRWRLFHHVDDPTRLTELFAVESWEEHLAQHRRIDDASAALLRRAREFDRDGGPRTRHLIAIDVDEPPDFEALLATHDEMHRVDGSVDLPDQG